MSVRHDPGMDRRTIAAAVSGGGRGTGASVPALLVSLLAFGVFGACSGDAPAEVVEARDPRLEDGRIAELFQGCRKGGYYDRFVDDVVPFLVEKLATAGGDPLKRAKEELGALGEPAADALRRLFDESYTNAELGPVVENVLDAAALNPTDTSHGVIRRALDHPMEAVRHRAMIGMIARHAKPSDFDVFAERVGGPESVEMQRLYLRGMFEADAARAEATALAWLQEDRFGPFWLDCAQRLGASRLDETARVASEVYQDLEPPFSTWLAGPAARLGDEGALEYLREQLEADLPNRRLDAVRALIEADLIDELEVAVLEDPVDSVRIFALDGVAKSDALEARHMDWLGMSLSDGSAQVREAALKSLCELGDQAALDLALSHLLGHIGELQFALQALRGPMLEDEDLSRRALERLLERDDLESLRPLKDRGATFKAIGVVPLAAAAAFLRERALEGSGGTMETLRVHEWLMIQASNTGRAGRDFLWEELAGETDPLRRLDLIDAVTSTRDEDTRDQARERMLSLAEDPSLSEYERLYAARRAIKVGPSAKVAPRLKLVANSFSNTQVQVALQCLLWEWY